MNDLLYSHGNIKIITLKPNGFKNESNDTLKLLGHQQWFTKQKTVTLHHRGFKWKSPKHCYCDRY